MNGKDSINNNLYGGPIDFLDYLYNAEYVLTDSFHGLAFSLTFNKKFFVFDRNYVYDNQATRLKCLLKKVNLENRFLDTKITSIADNINYEIVNKIIEEEREKSIGYLKNNLK